MAVHRSTKKPVERDSESATSKISVKSVKVLNVAIDNLSQQELFLYLKHGGVVFTPNVDHVIKLQNDADFYQVYQFADYCVCDSKIIYWASRLLGTPIREKLSGSDLLPNFCNFYRTDPSVLIFLLGAGPGIAKQAQQRINERTGRQIIVDAHSPSYGFEQDASECAAIVECINQSGATVLFVGVGTPKQEKWIAQYASKLTTVKTILAVGAAIDFMAGHKQRAPQWVSYAGLEWLFRLIQEPARLWKRYLLEDMPFFWLVMQQKRGQYKNPW